MRGCSQERNQVGTHLRKQVQNPASTRHSGARTISQQAMELVCWLFDSGEPAVPFDKAALLC